MTYIEEAAAYVRVSHQEQKMHGISLDAQVQKIEEYAEKNNIKIVEWYKDEGVSGRKPIKNRPELQRMIHDAQGGKFKRILFIKLDRFFRSVSEYHECMKLIEPVIWTATEEKYSLADANGRAFVNMKLTIAELEADQTGERIKIVNDYKVKSGMPLFGTDSMPFCFAVSSKEGEKTKSIVKRNEAVIEDAIAHVMVNHSIAGAHKYIMDKHNFKIGYNAFARALRNEMLCGSYRGNPNYCPPYITREMFDELQTIITRNPRSTDNEYSYIFTGLINCPCCGNKLLGNYNTHRHKDGNVSIYRGYRCNKAKMNKACDFRTTLMEKRFEKTMLERIESFVEEREVAIQNISEKTVYGKKVDVKALQEELERLNYSWQKGRIKKVEEYDQKYDDLVAQIEAAETTKEEAPRNLDHVRAILTDGWKGIYEALDNDHKRAFWRSFIKEINVDWSKANKDITEVIFF